MAERYYTIEVLEREAWRPLNEAKYTPMQAEANLRLLRDANKRARTDKRFRKVINNQINNQINN